MLSVGCTTWQFWRQHFVCLHLLTARTVPHRIQNRPYPPADFFYESAVSRQGTDKQRRFFVGRVSVGSTTGAEKNKKQKIITNRSKQKSELRPTIHYRFVSFVLHKPRLTGWFKGKQTSTIDTCQARRKTGYCSHSCKAKMCQETWFPKGKVRYC